jgi:hypothetical protein
MTHGNKIWVQMKPKYYSTHIKQINERGKILQYKKYEKMLNLGGFWPTTPNDPTLTISMSGETLTRQRFIPNMKTIPSKLWFLASVNQTVSGGGRGQDQYQSIPDFVRGNNDYLKHFW